MAKLVSKTYGDALFAVASEENRMDEFFEAAVGLTEVLRTNEDFGKLMSHPKIILMDEPSMGLSPIFVEEVFKIIRDISAEGVTVLLVEQNAKKALNIADRAYVLETGNIILQGDAKKLMNDESVKKAYLGE